MISLLAADAAAAEVSSPPASRIADERAEKQRYVFVGLSPVEPIFSRGVGGAVEVRILRSWSAGLGGAIGPIYTIGTDHTAYEDVTGNVLGYFWGDFNGGLQLGLQGAYRSERRTVHSESSDSEAMQAVRNASSADRRTFFGMGPLVGAKIGTRVGFTANIQLAFLVGNEAQTTIQSLAGTTTHVDSLRLRPTLAANAGWSF
jgi:hypothetical protein